MDAIKDAGYQVLDLAHNHILDSQIEGVVSTADAIEKAGMTPIGVYTHESRDQAPLVIKDRRTTASCRLAAGCRSPSQN